MFPFFNHYPGTDLHEIDLAYILKLCAELLENDNELEAWKTEHEEEYLELKTEVDNIIGETLSLLGVRKYVFIGDSWIQAGEMMNDLATLSGLTIGTNMFYSGSGGAGFVAKAITGYTFGEQIPLITQQLVNASIDPTTITDVVFMGGVNDSASTTTEIINAGNAAVTAARAAFENAEIWVMPLTTNAAASGRANIIQSVIAGYSRINAHFCGNAPYVIHALEYLQNDGIHPNPDGMMRCAEYVRNAIINKSDTIPARRFGQGLTANDGITLTGHTFWTWEDGKNIYYQIPDFVITLSTPRNIVNGITIDIGHFAVGGLDILPNVADLMQQFKTQVLVFNSTASPTVYHTLEAELRFGVNTDRQLTVSLYIARGQTAFSTAADKFIILGNTGTVFI